MSNYPIGDFLIRIKNASLSRKSEVSFPKNKLVMAAGEALKKAGFLDSIEKKDDCLVAHITYKKGEPAILKLKLISRPGLRIYMGVDELEKKRGASIYLLSTPKGIITSREAKKIRVGGEVIAEIL